MLRTVVNPSFKVGQVLGYETRPHEAGSTLTIVRTETDGRLNIQNDVNAAHKRVTEQVQNADSLPLPKIETAKIVLREWMKAPLNEQGIRAGFEPPPLTPGLKSGPLGVPASTCVDERGSHEQSPLSTQVDIRFVKDLEFIPGTSARGPSQEIIENEQAEHARSCHHPA